jgi:hypothetical protein
MLFVELLLKLLGYLWSLADRVYFLSDLIIGTFLKIFSQNLLCHQCLCFIAFNKEYSQLLSDISTLI